MLARIVLSIFLSLGFGFLTQPLQAQTVLDTVCAGARGVDYRVLGTVGSSYLWKVEGGRIACDNGTCKIAVDWGRDTGIFPIEVIEYNSNGCPGDTVRAFVWIRSGISITVEGPKVICEGDEVALRASGAKKLVWNGVYRSHELIVKPSQSQTYTVVGYSKLCGIDTAYFSLQVNKRPKAAIAINPFDPLVNELVQFTSTRVSGNEASIWNINQGSLIVEGDETYHSFSNIGNQQVQLIVIDPNGCADTANASFYVDSRPRIFVPNSFTPNGDGLNDTFAATADEIESIQLSIYDRWGALVYRGANEEARWDGRYKGETASEGVYVYHIQAKGLNKLSYEYNGTLTLIR